MAANKKTRKEKVIEVLNKARSMELFAIHQYMNQHYNLSDKDYVAHLKARMQDRLNYVEGLETAEGGFNKLPADAAEAIRRVVDEANSL